MPNKMINQPIIDGHAHAAREYSTIGSLLEMVEKFNLQKIVLCTSLKNDLNIQDAPKLPVKRHPDSNFFLNRINRFAYNHLLKDHGDGNNYVLNLAEKLPNLIIPFLWINPLEKSHLMNLENQIAENKFRGIKLHQAWNAFKIDSKEFKQIAETARKYNLPVFIHLYSKKEATKLAVFITKNQDITFIIAHLLGMKIFSNYIEHLKNVYFDTSGGYVIKKEHIQFAIETFGINHIIFGTDMPFEKIEDQTVKIENLNLSEIEKDKIFRLNAMKILKLKDKN
jgi:predicted TIM-barrel fold metal-dependent hydrolase